MSRDLSQKIAELKIKTARISGQPITRKKTKYDPSEVIGLGDKERETVDPKYGPPYKKAPHYRYRKQMGASESQEDYYKNLQKKLSKKKHPPQDFAAQIDCPQMKLEALKAALTDDRIDPKTKKQKHKFTLLEKGEYGIGKKY